MMKAMKIYVKFLLVSLGLFGIFMLSGCSKEPAAVLTKSGLNPADFQTDSTALYVLRNSQGMEVCITNYGGRIVSVMVPDKQDSLRDVVLGFDNVASYYPENNKSAFGASIGRYANRIVALLLATPLISSPSTMVLTPFTAVPPAGSIKSIRPIR